jgi:DNA polymerase-1
MYDFHKREFVDDLNIKSKIGVEASKVVDYLSLVGDTSDNIPGVLGTKAALSLLTEYGSVENLLKNLDQLNPKLKQ